MTLRLLSLLALFSAALTASAETVCIACHSSQSGRGGKAVIDWRPSIHAEQGVSCHDCHGGDPSDAVNAMSPSRGFKGVPPEKERATFCGACHVGIGKEFSSSTHGKRVGRGGPTCITCHGSHTIQRVSLDIISESLCGRCHTYRQAALIRDEMGQTERLLRNTETKIDSLRNEGMDTESLTKRLFAARNSYHAIFHELDVQRVKAESVRSREELQQIETSLGRLNQERHQRRIIGAGVVGTLLIAALLLYLLRREIRY
ncbi:MAG TPA: cytochrome c3 family protein [Geobacterales bacterium]|nr:cytochrome c3 family protein [Geobacterales bacterium]